MYLVHVQLRHQEGALLPIQAPSWIFDAARQAESVEHVVVHRPASATPVLGVYLLADRLEDAEQRAADLCRHVLYARPELSGWGVTDAQVPLLRFDLDG
jgi:hypothetical protein